MQKLLHLFYKLGNSKKISNMGLYWKNWKNFFSKTVVKDWSRPSESPSLEVLKRWVDVVLGTWFSDGFGNVDI